jgi:hemerythrin-like metal-binding protein
MPSHDSTQEKDIPMRSFQPKNMVATNQQFFERDPTWPFFAMAAPVFETGVGTIDLQHRMLIGRLEAIERTIGFPSNAFACQSLDNFADLAIKHLRDEKRFLENMNYPLMEELQREHEWNLIELERICEEFRGGDINHLPAALESLWQWTIEHIIESDSRYMPFLSGVDSHFDRTASGSVPSHNAENDQHGYPGKVETA